MSSKLFCPMCISSGGSTSGSRKRRKGHRSSVDSVGSDNDDDNFYRPSKEALKSKTSSISTSDPDQPFHVPSIFKPIRVDSPALFVHGSSSTVSENRGGSGGGGSRKGDTGDLPDVLASSSEEEIGCRSKAIGNIDGDDDDGDCTDDNNVVLGRGNEKGGKIKLLESDDNNDECEGDDSEVEMCTSKQAEAEKKKRDNDKMKRVRATAAAATTTMVSAKSHEKEWKRSCKDATNKTDDISKSVGATSSPRTRKSLGLTHGGSPTIARARPRAGSDFRKKLKQPTTTLLPKSEELEADGGVVDAAAILNPADQTGYLHQHESNDEKADKNQQECCAYSLDSQSSRSLSVNYDSHCPDAEARQPLLFATSELDLVSDDEEDEEGDIMEEDEEELVEEEGDEEEEEEEKKKKDERQQGFVPDTHATSQVIDNSPFQGETQEKDREKEKECVERGDLDKSTEKFSQVNQQKIVIPQIVTGSSGGNMGVVDGRENILLIARRQQENPPSSINSSKSSTPAPPPLPECPPPDSESDSWSRSGSNTRCPSRSGREGGGGSHFYFHFSSSHRNKRQSCSCGTSPARDQHQHNYNDHAAGGDTGISTTEDGGAGSSSGHECKGALSLVDMSQIHYADSASSCCGSDICDMGEGDNTITRLSTNNTAATTVKNNNCVVHTSSSPSCASSTFVSKSTTVIAPSRGTAAVATNTDDDNEFDSNNGCHSFASCHHPTAAGNDQIGNENRRYDATPNFSFVANVPPSASSFFVQRGSSSEAAAEMDADKANKSTKSYVSPVVKKVSASVNTDIVVPPSFQVGTESYNENDDEHIAMTVMALDRSDSQEELRSTSTTPTPPKYALGTDDNAGAGEMREFRLLPSLQQPLDQQQDSHSKLPSASSSPRVMPAKAKGIRSSSVTITLMRTPRETQTEQDGMITSGENKEWAESDPTIMWSGVAERRKNSAPERIPTMISYTTAKSGRGNNDDDDGNDNQPETRILAEGYYYSEMDLDLALQNKHMQASGKWHYPYHSTGHVPAADDPGTPLVLAAVSGDGGEEGEYEDPVVMIEEEEEDEEEDENTIEDLRPLISTSTGATNTTSVDAEYGVDQSPQVHYRGVRTNVTGSWFSLSSSSSLEDYDEKELIMASTSSGVGGCEAAGRSSSSGAATAAALLASAAAHTSISSFDPERWSPESSPSLSILSYEEILTEQQKIQQDVQRVVDAVKQQQNFNKTDNIGDGGHALDLASQSNVQDAFVIAVEQQARERLEKLSALKKIKPVDMTKLSHQLSEAPSESGETSAELNGLIEAATGSPIYVTSASELNSSQSASHRTTVAAPAAGGTGTTTTTTSEESQEGKPSPSRSTPTSTVTTRAVISSGPELSPSKRSGSNVTVVGVNTSTGSTSLGGTCLPNGQYSSGATTGDRSTASSVGEPVLPAKKSISKESVNGSRKSGSRESITDSRESVQFEGAKPSPSRSRGSASKLASQSSSRESVIEASSSSQYANMINMVEWDNGPHREMAVDVPESFVPRNKTPPRYPPTNKTTTLNSNNNKTAGKSVVSDGVGVRGNGAATLPGQNGAAGKPVPPPRIGDNKEGVYGVNNNTTQVPLVTPRTVIGQPKTAATTPSRDEAERIRKYQEELKKRREQEEKHAKEEEFLRTSLRGSKKLQALESVREDRSYPTGEPKGFVNEAYDLDGDRISHPPHDITLQKPVGLPELVASLQRVQQALKKHGVQLDEAVSAVGTLMQTPEFQQVLAVHNKVQDVWCFNAPPNPVTAHAQQLNQECLESLYNCSSPASAELVEILSRIDMDGVLHAHDKIAERERLLMTAESPLNAGEPVDPVITSSSTVAPALPVVPAAAVVGGSHMKSVPRPAFVPEPQPDDHIKVVRIEKTQDPLGATVRNDADAVVIGRIVKGGAAERSGLLHEGDEILEVNGVEMRGKSVNEVCDILSRMTGTLTFLIVPTQVPQPPIQQRRDILIHVRAHFDYDPEDDIYIPCRELGVAFAKGDVLHVINQEDPNWWQAHREGEEDQQLAGLIPSKSFQEQREAVKQTLLGETETREKTKKGTLLCAKTHKKKKKKIPYSSAFNDGKEFDAEEIPTYEEVALYYPRTSFKRPVVLIGPPNIGRHELRQRLMQESDRFAAAVPHTSRSRKDGEIDGQDYHFISRAQFESDILSRKFVEHGEFEKAYYGTSLDAIRSVVNAGKICVLNLHPQSLKILRSSDLKPYIVFIAPPPLERLKQMRIARGEAYKEDELIDIIEKAREMEEKYGHYFDLVIVNNDIERTYHELVQRINYIEREPQWVPAFWLKQ